ncbi:MAG: tRNA (adenosine(37)-N6)-dimethylallyltransferase MiaA, partial [Patescibacteria group bacterium]
MKHKVIAIVGPTASGKSALGVFLAQKLGGEIISADSRQVYRGLNIGTGKVTKKEMGGIPHHLLDVASPKRIFSASDFEKLGQKAIEKILKEEKIPMVVGGTGFYVDTLLGRMTLPDVPPNPRLRAKLEKKTVEALFKELEIKDPERATTIEPKHKRRIIRALEIAAGRSKKKSEGDSHSATARARANFQQKIMRTPEGLLFAQPDILWLGIAPDEKVLHKKIHVRLLARMKAGMVSEAKRLHAQGLSYKRMKELGLEYRSLAELLLGEATKEEVLPRLEAAIRNYAKRQLTWFRNQLRDA